MAISIDSVYKEILNIIRNEDLEKVDTTFEGSSSSSRGRRSYMTPVEFNVLAERAQSDIFEKLLEEYKLVYYSSKDYDNNTELDLVQQRMNPFRVVSVEIDKTNGYPTDVVTHPLSSIYWVEDIYTIGASSAVQFKEVSKSYFSKVKAFSTNKVFLKKDLDHIYYKENDGVKMYLYPTPTANPRIDYIKKPTTPKWDSVVNINTGVVSYSAGGSIDFQLHESERSSLINKILYLAGMSTEKPQLSDMALKDEANNEVAKNN